MAFLDNSGDIILDAVLTEIGRKKLGRGAPLNIQMFALGDDEINYGLYDLTVESALSDLEILQTPVLESVTARAAGINHGLLRMAGAMDLLYLPVVKYNSKAAVWNSGWTPTGTWQQTVTPINNVFLAIANVETWNMLNTSAATGTGLLAAATSGNWGMKSWPGSGASSAIMFEAGLDTTDLAKFPSFRPWLNNLRDDDFSISLDKRLFGGALVSRPGGSIANKATTTGAGVLDVNISPAGPLPAGSPTGAPEMYNYMTVPAAGSETHYFVVDAGVPIPVTDISVIAGPGSTACGANPIANAWMSRSVTDILYSQIGNTATSDALFGDGLTGNDFVYIDTFMYVTGLKTGVSTQVAIRLIKKA